METRYPYFGTNFANPLQLAGMRQFCQFTAKGDGSRIHILLSTLYATKPTLAALAYYAKVPLQYSGGGNPASFYCTQLGGSDQFGGTNIGGGGWVQWGAIDESLEACIFPDMSSIDSWGLTYHSASIDPRKKPGQGHALSRSRKEVEGRIGAWLLRPCRSTNRASLALSIFIRADFPFPLFDSLVQ